MLTRRKLLQAIGAALALPTVSQVPAAAPLRPLPLAPNQWQHIWTQRTAGLMRYFVNGVFIGTEADYGLPQEALMTFDGYTDGFSVTHDADGPRLETWMKPLALPQEPTDES